jgi:hypothetical protein
VNQANYTQANELLTPNSGWVFLPDCESFRNATGGATNGWKLPLFSFWRSEFTKLGVAVEPRTTWDYVFCRQRFGSAHSSWHFTADRGTIRFDGDVRTVWDPEAKALAVMGEISDGYETIALQPLPIVSDLKIGPPDAQSSHADR